MEALDIIYEDEVILVCYKPAGIATQTNRLGQQDMVSLLRNYRARKREDSYIGVVHRLDQPVEGIMVFAKTNKAAAFLSDQVGKRTIGKKYFAVCKKADHVNFEGIRKDYLLFDKKTNHTKVVPAGTKNAKEAKLEYRIVYENEQYSMFDITLHTGRHHQIRVQFANMGCPLFGDMKYGSSEQDCEKVGRNMQLALCSYQLSFVHPTTKKNVEYRIEPHNPIFRMLVED